MAEHVSGKHGSEVKFTFGCCRRAENIWCLSSPVTSGREGGGGGGGRIKKEICQKSYFMVVVHNPILRLIILFNK